MLNSIGYISSLVLVADGFAHLYYLNWVGAASLLFVGWAGFAFTYLLVQREMRRGR